jgi:hypothetical protein
LAKLKASRIDRNQILANGTVWRRANRALPKQGRNGGSSSNSESPWDCPPHFAIAAAAQQQCKAPLQLQQHHRPNLGFESCGSSRSSRAVIEEEEEEEEEKGRGAMFLEHPSHLQVDSQPHASHNKNN